MTVAFDIASLKAAYADGTATPEAILAEAYRRIAERGEKPVWIALVPLDIALAKLAAARERQASGETLPLFGIPFAVKDNIDVAGMPTTAACPAFAYKAERSATVVEKLEKAGAILIGKTNLDQFATGLVGTRSPYGVCASVFDPAYIAGGSSSGSAVAVAAGLVGFALGTDTAGSGRVPAAFNNIVGLKPTKGLISTRGVVPACRSLDCVSIFSATVGDALGVLTVAQGFDDNDPWSRPLPATANAARGLAPVFRFGLPTSDQLEFFGDDAAAALFAEAVQRLRDLGGEAVEIDYAPFADAAHLLYQGPWVAERYAAIRSFGFDQYSMMDPVVRDIIRKGADYSAIAGFEATYKLATLTRQAERQWAAMDVLLLPTAGTTYRIDAIEADPIRLNSTLGLYTNFVNLMDLAATAIPAGFRPNGLPFGVTLIGRAGEDGKIAALADRLHRSLPSPTVGGTGLPLPPASRIDAAVTPATVTLAVVGAHLSGQPLNWQLTDRQARLVRTARTAAGYSLYALAQTTPAKPGLIYDGIGDGFLEVELWELDFAAFGSFVAAIPPPLGIGTIALEDGSRVKSFLCETYATLDAENITAFGGWRRWLARGAA